MNIYDGHISCTSSAFQQSGLPVQRPETRRVAQQRGTTRASRRRRGAMIRCRFLAELRRRVSTTQVRREPASNGSGASLHRLPRHCARQHASATPTAFPSRSIIHWHSATTRFSVVNNQLPAKPSAQADVLRRSTGMKLCSTCHKQASRWKQSLQGIPPRAESQRSVPAERSLGSGGAALFTTPVARRIAVSAMPLQASNISAAVTSTRGTCRSTAISSRRLTAIPSALVSGYERP